MRTIDLHNHMVPLDVVRFIEQHGDRYETRIVERASGRFFVIQESAQRPINPRITDPDARLADMDAEGIDLQAVSCVPFLMYPEVTAAAGLAVARTVNDALAEAGKHSSGRFVALASVPLQDPPAAAKELERAVGMGMRGVQIPPAVQERGLDEPEFRSFWEAAEALEIVVCIHPFEATPRGVLSRYNLGNLVGNLYQTGLAAALLIYGGVLERHPRLRVTLFHAGGALPSLLGRLDAGYEFSAENRTAIPRLPSSYVNQFWFDSIAHNRTMLAYLVANYGAERLVIGSDYPLAAGLKHPVEEIKALNLSDEAESDVLGGNAAGLLSLA